jgi:type II secretory ATPase GspE/PulE/Tfp pilus assembly ATPase PilB-like protein|tara:strand:- start:252 stop:515 length:264 start_codon:yes stop_codon:yes gene_type:complete
MVVVLGIISILLGLAYSTLRTPNEQIACKEIFSKLQFGKMQAVSTKATLSNLHEVAKKEGLVNLRQMAISNMREGIITYEEVIAVTG